MNKARENRFKTQENRARGLKNTHKLVQKSDPVPKSRIARDKNLEGLPLSSCLRLVKVIKFLALVMAWLTISLMLPSVSLQGLFSPSPITTASAATTETSGSFLLPLLTTLAKARFGAGAVNAQGGSWVICSAFVPYCVDNPSSCPTFYSGAYADETECNVALQGGATGNQWYLCVPGTNFPAAYCSSTDCGADVLGGPYDSQPTCETNRQAFLNTNVGGGGAGNACPTTSLDYYCGVGCLAGWQVDASKSCSLSGQTCCTRTTTGVTTGTGPYYCNSNQQCFADQAACNANCPATSPPTWFECSQFPGYCGVPVSGTGGTGQTSTASCTQACNSAAQLGNNYLMNSGCSNVFPVQAPGIVVRNAGGPGQNGCSAGQTCYCVFATTQNVFGQNPYGYNPYGTSGFTGFSTSTVGGGVTPSHNWKPAGSIADPPTKPASDYVCNSVSDVRITAGVNSTGIVSGGHSYVAAGSNVLITGGVEKFSETCNGYQYDCKKFAEFSCTAKRGCWSFCTKYEYQQCPGDLPNRLHAQGKHTDWNILAIILLIAAIALVVVAFAVLAPLAAGTTLTEGTAVAGTAGSAGASIVPAAGGAAVLVPAGTVIPATLIGGTITEGSLIATGVTGLTLSQTAALTGALTSLQAMGTAIRAQCQGQPGYNAIGNIPLNPQSYQNPNAAPWLLAQQGQIAALQLAATASTCIPPPDPNCWSVCGDDYQTQAAAAPKCDQGPSSAVMGYTDATYPCGRGTCEGFADRPVAIRGVVPDPALGTQTFVDTATLTDSDGRFEYTITAPAYDGDVLVTLTTPRPVTSP